MLMGQIEDEQKTSDLIGMGRKFGKLKKTRRIYFML